MGSNSY